MKVTGLRLVNFRNYEQMTIRPHAGLCVLTGENAAGKTNVLEAVFLCALGRSHRTIHDAEMVRRGEEGAYVDLKLSTKQGGREIEIRIPPGERKQVSVDRSPIGKSAEQIGVLNVVMFAPEDLAIVKGGPSERRRFLDMTISQMFPMYYTALQQYNAVLRQRNALLKDPDHLYDGALEAWNGQLAILGANIMLRRAEQAERLADIASTMHETLSDGKEFLDMYYEPNVPISDPTLLVDEIRMALEDSRERDIRYGSTTVGPHRDDLMFSLDGTDVRTFGSQGQQRTTVLSLKLAQMEVLREERGEAPVLLLDDVFSELDRKRQEMLMVSVEGCQTFLTCTHLEDLEQAQIQESMQIYRVENGNITEE